jgi:catechol 2,3-dioxygenase-like lactoylglutathione lyase family enzyme
VSIKTVAHVCLKTRDLARTTDFYCGALGLKKAFDFVQRGKVIGFYLQAAGQSFIEVFRDPNVDPPNEPRMLHHFCLETDDIEALRQKLLDHGYAPGEVIMGADNTPQFWVTDPNGVPVEIQQYTPESTQLTGRNVEIP